MFEFTRDNHAEHIAQHEIDRLLRHGRFIPVGTGIASRHVERHHPG